METSEDDTFHNGNIDEVSSDLFCHVAKDSLAILDDNNCISRIEIAPAFLESNKCVGVNDFESDEEMEQDRVVKRRKRRKASNSLHVTISHVVSSSVDDVGFQLWRGALLLADFLFFIRDSLRDSVVVELGSGVGFIGVIMSLIPCKHVYITDMTSSLTQQMNRNLLTNSHLVSHLDDQSPVISTRVLDWGNNENAIRCEKSLVNTGGWSDEDAELLESSPVVWLAADVIYDDKITHDLFNVLAKNMKPGEHCYLALEKRFNFDLDALSLVAHGYKRFLNYIHMDHISSSAGEAGEEIVTSDKNDHVFFSIPGKSKAKFKGTRIPLDFPQVVNYHRVKDLELWDIEYEVIKCD